MTGVADCLAENASWPYRPPPDRWHRSRKGSTEVPNIGSTTTTAAPRATEVPTTSSRRQDDRCHRCHQPKEQLRGE